MTRARRSALVFALAGEGLCLVTQDRSLPADRVLGGHVAIVLLMTAAIATYRFRRLLWGEPVLVLPLVLLGGQGLAVQPATIALCLCVLAAQSLYGGRRASVVRTISVVAVPPLFVISSYVVPHEVAPTLQQIVVPMPLLVVFSLFLRTLYVALRHEQQANQREALLAETSRALLGGTDLSLVRTVEQHAAAAACELYPDLGIAFLRRGPSGALESLWSTGAADARESAGSAVAWSSLMPEADRLTPLPAAQQVSAAPKRRDRRARRASVLTVGAGREQLLLITHTGELAPAVGEMIETLAAQLAMAEMNCHSHAELVSLAHHDSLTQIANRAAFLAALERTVAEAVGHEEMVSLLVIDLDDFKVINDSLGHAAGDAVLVASADRMTEIAGEHGLAARFGGDEFAVLLTGVRDREETARLAETLLHQLIQPVPWEDEQLRVGASIGIVMGAPGLNAVDLMRCADIAMYSAKALGKNRVIAFTESDHGTIASTRQLEDQITRASLPEDVIVHYEPILDLHTHACAGLRAAARWDHPVMGALMPDEVIPLAERMGAVTDVDRAVLTKACHDAAEWVGAGNPRVDLVVGVSPQFLDGDMVAVVSTALKASGLPAERLTLEFEERTLLHGSEATRQFRVLEQLGVGTALSGFGGRVASLGTLESLHLRRIVVDAARLRPSEAGSDEFLSLVRAISRILGVGLDAGSVRSQDVASWLADQGLDRVSGHHIGHPMPLDQVHERLTGSVVGTADR